MIAILVMAALVCFSGPWENLFKLWDYFKGAHRILESQNPTNN